jgi:glutathione S-transferase
MHDTATPVLYSFRRCPYAMRARLALLASGVAWEHREVVLRHKPSHMLSLSPKGTVPVLCVRAWPDGLEKSQVLAESLDIMLWALRQHDPLAWLPSSEQAWVDAMACIAHNDGPFKQQLDRFKYPDRFGLLSGLTERDQAVPWLQSLNARLQDQAFLAGRQWGLSDAAIAPFVRQFAHTDPLWFAAQDWLFLADWLTAFESSDLYHRSMQKHPPWSAP